MPVVQQLEFPRDVATLVQVRGNMLLPLQLQEGANRAAKVTLDALANDDALFPKHTVASAPMAAAVRGLLYLWNGWLDECVTCGERAGEAEQLYLAALVARQQGNPAEAKQFFQQINGHDIFAQLSLDTEGLLADCTESAMRRFQQLLKMDQNWEAFAFIDLYEQCRQRKLSAAAERIVRGIQARELELLLVHTVEGALGERLKVQARPLDDLAERRARERERRRARAEEERRAKRKQPQSESPASERPAAPTAVAAPPELKIKCPKCKHAVAVPVTQRGQKANCPKCQAAFLVPNEKSTAGALAPPPPGSVGVHCPKCQTLAVLAPGARGKAHTCEKCAAQFLVPR